MPVDSDVSAEDGTLAGAEVSVDTDVDPAPAPDEPLVPDTLITTTDPAAQSTSVAAPPKQPDQSEQTSAAYLASIRSEAMAKKQANRDEKLDRIVAFATTKAKTKKTISLQDVRLLVDASHSAALLYLDQLVAEGRLVHVGSKNHGEYRAA